MKIIRIIAVTWGLSGVTLFLAMAVYRLGIYSSEITTHELTFIQLMLLVVWVNYMIYAEGIRAFGVQFSPKVVARAKHLLESNSFLELTLAPFFVFGYFHSTRKRLKVTYILTISIILFIILIRYLPQPWRAIIDLGAMAGIAYGTGTLIYEIIRFLKNPAGYTEDPLLPDSKTK